MRSKRLSRRRSALSRRLQVSSRVRGRRVGRRKGGRGSSDGSRSIVSRQLRHRRFCRRSEIQNSWSQRRHVAGPAYGPSFGTLRWGPFRGPLSLMAILNGERLSGQGSVSTLTPYRPRAPRPEGHTPVATEAKLQQSGVRLKTQGVRVNAPGAQGPRPRRDRVGVPGVIAGKFTIPPLSAPVTPE